MLQDMWNVLPVRPSTSAPSSPIKPIGMPRTRSESFHVTHKVPVGDTPYVKAKNVQLVDKDPERAIPLFWAAINAGDRVDSALKDMAIVMKQQNRAEEAIEAIKSLRSRCSDQSQESLDNILLDLFKRCGRLDDQITLLRRKLFLIQQGMAFNGKRTKTARSQGKKFQVSVAQEATRLLGNLGWALMQQNKYVEAEDAYRRALLMAPDNNKMCNLGICLMKQGRIVEAKQTLRMVKPAVADGPRGLDSHLKAFERARQMLADLESEMLSKGGADPAEQSRLFDAFLASSSLWQPQPCKDHHHQQQQQQINKPQDEFGDENIDTTTTTKRGGGGPMPMPMNQNSRGVDYPEQKKIVVNNNKHQQPRGGVVVTNGNNNSLNVGAMPFYSSKIITTSKDPMQETLKRTRSGHAANSVVGETAGASWKPLMEFKEPMNKTRRRSLSPDEEVGENWADLLPDNKEFEAALIAAVLGAATTETTTGKKKKTTLETTTTTNKIDSRLQDITLSSWPKSIKYYY